MSVEKKVKMVGRGGAGQSRYIFLVIPVPAMGQLRVGSWQGGMFFEPFGLEMAFRSWSLPVSRIFESHPPEACVLAVERPKAQIAAARQLKQSPSEPAHVDATPPLLSYEGRSRSNKRGAGFCAPEPF